MYSVSAIPSVYYMPLKLQERLRYKADLREIRANLRQLNNDGVHEFSMWTLCVVRAQYVWVWGLRGLVLLGGGGAGRVDMGVSMKLMYRVV